MPWKPNTSLIPKQTADQPDDRLMPWQAGFETQIEPVNRQQPQWSEQDLERIRAQKPALGKTDLGAETPSTFDVFTESAKRGLKSGFTSAKQGLLDPFADVKPESEPQDYTTQLLDQGISEGYSNPDWWVAHLTRGLTESSPTLGTGIVGGLGGGAIGGPPGALAGGAGGLAFGAIMQTIAPAYQAARAEGFDHETAVDRAIQQSKIAGWWSAAMGAAPGVPVFGKTAEGAFRRPISEALAQIFGVQPGLVAGRTVDESLQMRGELPSADQVGTAMAEAAGVGAILTGAHAGGRKLYNAATAPRETPVEVLPPRSPPEKPLSFIDLVPDAQGVYGGTAGPQRAITQPRPLLEAPRGGPEGAPPPIAPDAPVTPPRQPGGGQDTFSARESFAKRLKELQDTTPGPVRTEPEPITTPWSMEVGNRPTGGVKTEARAPLGASEYYHGGSYKSGPIDGVLYLTKDADFANSYVGMAKDRGIEGAALQRVDVPLKNKAPAELVERLAEQYGVETDGSTPAGWFDKSIQPPNSVKLLIAALQNQGYDHAELIDIPYGTGGDAQDVTIAFPKSSKSNKGKTDYAIEQAPLQGFYSPAQRTLNNVDQKRAPASQWVGILEKKNPAAGREARQLGLDIWLEEQGGGKAVSKEEINNWLKAHEIEVEQKTFTEPNLKQGQSRVEPYGDNYGETVIKVTNENFPFYDTPHFGENEILVVSHSDREGPNGEKLFSIEQVQSDIHQQGRQAGYGDPRLYEKFTDATVEYEDKYEEVHKGIRDSFNKGELGKYMHDSETGHYIMQDNKIVKHSPYGLGTSGARELFIDQYLMDLTNDHPEVKPLREEVLKFEDQVGEGKVPNVPFKGDLWWQLGLKWAISDAVNKGYSGIVLPTAAQIANASGGSASGLKVLYEQKIPKWLKKYVKQWDAELKPIEIDDFNDTSFKARLEQAISDFESSSYRPNFVGQSLYDARKSLLSGTTPDTVYRAMHPDAQTRLAAASGKSTQNQYIEITPKMREDLTDSGQSLFAKAPVPGRFKKKSIFDPIKGKFTKPFPVPPNLTGLKLRQQIQMLLDAGRPVTISEEIQNTLFNLVDQNPGLIPEGTDVNSLARIDPVGDDRVRMIFRDRDGTETALYGNSEDLFSSRALYASDSVGGSSLFFFRFNTPSKSERTVLGEMWHEATHALRRQGYFSNTAWDGLVSHANSLDILSMEYRDYARAIKSPNWQEFPEGVTLRDMYERTYLESYANSENPAAEVKEALDQEAVAALLELNSHGVLIPEQIEPISSIIEDIRAGNLSVGGGQKPEVELPYVQTIIKPGEVLVYHGTATEKVFDVFDINASQYSGDIYFSDNPKLSDTFTGADQLTYDQYNYTPLQDITHEHRPRIIPAIISTDNFKTISLKNYDWLQDDGKKLNRQIKKAKEENYAGLIVKNIQDNSIVATQYIVWTPNTVRSAITGDVMFAKDPIDPNPYFETIPLEDYEETMTEEGDYNAIKAMSEYVSSNNIPDNKFVVYSIKYNKNIVGYILAGYNKSESKTFLINGDGRQFNNAQELIEHYNIVVETAKQSSKNNEPTGDKPKIQILPISEGSPGNTIKEKFGDHTLTQIKDNLGITTNTQLKDNFKVGIMKVNDDDVGVMVKPNDVEKLTKYFDQYGNAFYTISAFESFSAYKDYKPKSNYELAKEATKKTLKDLEDNLVVFNLIEKLIPNSLNTDHYITQKTSPEVFKKILDGLGETSIDPIKYYVFTVRNNDGIVGFKFHQSNGNSVYFDMEGTSFPNKENLGKSVSKKKKDEGKIKILTIPGSFVQSLEQAGDKKALSSIMGDISKHQIQDPTVYTLNYKGEDVGYSLVAPHAKDLVFYYTNDGMMYNNIQSLKNHIDTENLFSDVDDKSGTAKPVHDVIESIKKDSSIKQSISSLYDNNLQYMINKYAVNSDKSIDQKFGEALYKYAVFLEQNKTFPKDVADKHKAAAKLMDPTADSFEKSENWKKFDERFKKAEEYLDKSGFSKNTIKDLNTDYWISLGNQDSIKPYFEDPGSALANTVMHYTATSYGENYPEITSKLYQAANILKGLNIDFTPSDDPPEGYAPAQFKTLQEAAKTLSPLALELFNTLSDPSWVMKSVPYAPQLTEKAKVSKVVKDYVDKLGSHLNKNLKQQLLAAAEGLVPQPIKTKTDEPKGRTQPSTKEGETPKYATIKEAVEAFVNNSPPHMMWTLESVQSAINASKDIPFNINQSNNLAEWDKFTSNYNKDIVKAIKDIALKIHNSDIAKQLKSITNSLQIPKPLSFGDLLKQQREEDPLSRHYTFVGKASGGTKPKEVWVDQDGVEYMFKPVPKGSEFLAHSEAIGGQIARIANPKAPEIFTITLNNRLGTLQKYVPNTGTLRELGTKVKDLTVDQIKALQNAHVVDWLISNHDAHDNQFLMDEDGGIIPIDKGQAFKHLGSDQLSIDYHPNSKFGEKEPIYNTIWRAYKNGELTQFEDNIKLDENLKLSGLKKQLKEKEKEYRQLRNDLEQGVSIVQDNVNQFKRNVADSIEGSSWYRELYTDLEEISEEIADVLQLQPLKDNQYYASADELSFWASTYSTYSPARLFKDKMNIKRFMGNYSSMQLVELGELTNSPELEKVIEVYNKYLNRFDIKLEDYYLSDLDALSDQITLGAHKSYDYNNAIRHAGNELSEMGYDHFKVGDNIFILPNKTVLKSTTMYDVDKFNELNSNYQKQIPELGNKFYKAIIEGLNEVIDPKAITFEIQELVPIDIVDADTHVYLTGLPNSLLYHAENNLFKPVKEGRLDDNIIQSGMVTALDNLVERTIKNLKSAVLDTYFKYVKPDLLSPSKLSKISSRSNELNDEMEKIRSKLRTAREELDDALYTEVLKTIQKLQSTLDNNTYRNLLTPYAKSLFKGRESVIEAFLDFATERKNKLGVHFYNFYSSLDDIRERAREGMASYSHSGGKLSEGDRSNAKSIKQSYGKFKPLSAAEIKAIQDYTGSAYGYINPALRKSPIEYSSNKIELNKNWVKYADYANLITSGLNKLPAHKGIVYRREHETYHSHIKNLKIGQIYSNSQFLSSTTNVGKHGAAKVLFKIISETGRWVGDISHHKSENEVLFSPNRMFLITNILVDANGNYLIHMRELEHVDFSQIEQQTKPIKEEGNETTPPLKPEEEGYNDDDEAW